MSAGSFWCVDPNLRDRRSLKNTKFDVDDSGTYMYLHPLPRETVLPLLLGEHFPHSIAVAGKNVTALIDTRAVLRQLLERRQHFVPVLGQLRRT